MGKFRMYGCTVQLYRWQVDYDLNGTPMTEKYPNEEEADAAVARTGGTKTAIDVTGDEWIDGITVPETTQPMKAALEIYEAGPPYVPPVDEIAAIKNDITNTQIGLTEVYELLLGGAL